MTSLARFGWVEKGGEAADENLDGPVVVEVEGKHCCQPARADSAVVGMTAEGEAGMMAVGEESRVN